MTRYTQTMTDKATNWPLIQRFLDNVVTFFNELRTDSDALNDYVARMNDRDGVIGGSHTLGVGTGTSTKVRMSGTIRYRIDGVDYSAANLEVVLATGEITHNTNGAWRITIDKTGTLATQRATANGTSGTMAYASAEIALLNLAQIARPASTVDVGYLMIHATSGQGGFTPGTDDPATSDDQVDVATYYNCRMPHLDNGFTAAPSVSLSEGTNNDEFAFGTINVRTNGLNLAQIAADTTIAFTQNDVITSEDQLSGHLFITDTAGTAILSLAATGIAGAVQTMTYTTLTLATAALDAVQLALPKIYTVIGRMTCVANKDSFAFNTDDLAGTDGTATWTDEVATAYDRTDVAGTGVGPGVPTIPAVMDAADLTKNRI